MSTNIKNTSLFVPLYLKSVFTGVIVLSYGQINSQSSTINQGIIYAMNGMTIQNYDPTLPVSASNPVNNGITLPAGAAGLAVCNGISSGPGPSTRFYTTLAGIYYYWDGNNWVNTGHLTGDPGAVNIGGGGGYIYNLVGSTGDVYKYDGNGNGTLIATLPTFAGGGPYDMVVDNNGNFYMLQTTTPQSLKVYNPNGQEICSYNLVGMPNLWAGGGYAIIDNLLYVYNGAFYTGVFTGKDIVFTSAPSPLNNPNDFASSPFNYTDAIQASISSLGTLGCSSSTVSAVVATNLASANFNWSGPGISVSNNSGDITVSLPGLYSCTVTPSGNIGCPAVANMVIVSIGIGIIPGATVSQPLSCVTPTTQLSVMPSASAHTYTWTGNGIVSGANSQSAIVNTGGNYTVTVQNTITGCIGTETINVQNPINTLNLSTTNVAICQGEVATLSVNGNATSYTWDNSSASLSSTSGSTVYANPAACTIYTVTGTLGTCTTSAIIDVTVNPLPTVAVLPCNATICAGLSGTTFTASGAQNFTWLGAQGLSSTNGAVVNANPSASTIYTVIGTANSCTNSATFTVTTSNNLILSVTPTSTTICEGTTANVVASGAASYTWDNNINTNGLFSVSPTTTTIYTVTGTNGSCTGTQFVTVNVVPKPVVTITSNTTSVCAGDNVTIYTNGASSFVWATNSSLSCSITGAVIATPSVSSVYTVTGTNVNGSTSCSDIQAINITVLPSTTGNIIEAQTICEGSSVMLYATGGTDVEWLPSTGLSSSSSLAPNASPLSTIIYTAHISKYGECPDTKTVSVTVNPLPKVNAGSDTTILHGDYITLSGEGDGQLKWTAGEYLNCNQCSKAYVAPLNNTCYILEATNQYGCKNTDARCIEVQKEYDFYIPNTFTPNGDGLNDVFTVVGTGVSQLEFYVYDRWGNQIYHTTDVNNGWDGTDKGTVCKNGSYVCRVKATYMNGKVEVRYGSITLYGIGEL